MANLALDLQLPEDLVSTLDSFLQSSFKVLKEPESSSRVTLFDTFDWRLFQAGTLLRVSPSRRGFLWSWCHLDGEVRDETWESSLPGLLSSLGDNSLRRKLQPIVSMRRLLPLVELSYRNDPMRIVDEEEKTRVRLFRQSGEVRVHKSLEDISSRTTRPRVARPLPTVLRLQSLRGYEGAFRRLEKALSQDFGCQPCADNLLLRALKTSGTTRTPGDYTSKPDLDLDPAAPAAEAARQIHRVLLGIMLRNEAGLRRDDDSEFLHDFRVAVRRTRSALSQIKKVFPPQPLEHFRREFSWLGNLTGPTRDLDVFLLKMEDYRALLPAAVGKDLDPLTDFLADKQRREQRKLVQGLNSSRYGQLIEDWRALLEGEAQDVHGGQPIVGLATRRIWRLYRRVIKDGRHILQVASDAEAHANALHDLRIECKKLRYSLEFFRSLYPRGEVDPLIRALKKLQDNLGDFNDFEVQRHKLAGFADEMMGRKASKAATFLAMGRLMTFLAEAQERERLGFEVRFLTFIKNKEQFEKLFAPAK